MGLNHVIVEDRGGASDKVVSVMSCVRTEITVHVGHVMRPLGRKSGFFQPSHLLCGKYRPLATAPTLHKAHKAQTELVSCLLRAMSGVPSEEAEGSPSSGSPPHVKSIERVLQQAGIQKDTLGLQGAASCRRECCFGTHGRANAAGPGLAACKQGQWRGRGPAKER
jgi:hypothetical protein